MEEDNYNYFKQYFPMVITNCELLMNLINDILDHQQIIAGRFRITPSVFQFDELLQQIYSLFQIQCKEKNIQFILKRNKNLTINSDKNRIKQVLINFISNSIKFTKNGKIQLKTNLSKDKTLLSISIRDTGSGIPKEVQEKLFQPFSTFDNMFGNNRNGVGLGLCMCQNLVSQLGPYKKIFLESHIGKGRNRN
ncbi:hypothetical protein IMG5_136110 [Ichthyophthirius multifiliis]|uniref:Histidine kinase domain-containing protein n=1 Tax=Ichthyophthirius multifiliis TaxID=5932 RepID=G0QWX5_ICHMU|nr:hypothetical protein IMG5_136110 [Ichthyophthirius multifiliis]EGR30281.1 hypothetical protein IMG5_136110 [Ichthyophthirius multifiliis]|eukprot:XP_004031868.1 hypothetical protein IMG5_136110 [Ichthyophthirius multifiliis]